MIIVPPSEIEIVRDLREKDKAIFPKTLEWKDDRGNEKVLKIKVTDETLTTGDYVLRGYESVAMIERKGSIQEIRDNLYTADRARFRRCIARLVEECKYPYFLITVPLNKLTDPHYGDQSYGEVLDATMRWVHRHRLRLLWLPFEETNDKRRKVGELILRVLWNHAWENQHEIPS
jgi:ERCC4-type nuclease